MKSKGGSRRPQGKAHAVVQRHHKRRWVRGGPQARR